MILACILLAFFVMKFIFHKAARGNTDFNKGVYIGGITMALAVGTVQDVVGTEAFVQTLIANTIAWYITLPVTLLFLLYLFLDISRYYKEKKEGV